MEDTNPPPGSSGDLNFDKADYGSEEPAISSCVMCRGPLDYQYFEVNQKVLCPPCKDKLEDQIAQGKGAARYIRAFLFALPAGMVGAGIYYAIRAVTGYELGIIAILIGYMVGLAVRYGSNHRGGIGLQFMAAIITYFAICSTYVPYIIEGMRQDWNLEEVALEEGLETIGEDETGIGSMSKDEAQELLSGVITDETLQDFDRYSPAGGVTTIADNSDAAVDPSETAMVTAGASAAGEKKAPLTAYLLGYLVIFAFALAAPWLAGFSYIIVWLIIGIGVYQAWIMNKFVPIEIKGPFEIKKR